MTKPYPYFPGQSGTRPRRFSDLLKQRDSILAGLRQQVLELERLNSLLGEFLDNPLLEHVQIAAVSDSRLILTADSPVWGHRVRYLAPAIVEFLHARGELKEVRGTRILVRPPVAGYPRLTSSGAATKSGISPRSAQLLRQVAEELEHPELARRLLRLSRQHRP